MRALRSSVGLGPLLVAVLVTLTVSAGPSAQAQDPARDAVCAVLTADEVGQFLGTDVVAGQGWTYDDYSTCHWIASDPGSMLCASSMRPRRSVTS